LILKKIHFQIQQVRFASQMSLRIITEMLKNAPVLLKRLCSYLQVIPTCLGYSGYLNGDRFYCVHNSDGKSPFLNEVNFDGQLSIDLSKKNLYSGTMLWQNAKFNTSSHLCTAHFVWLSI